MCFFRLAVGDHRSSHWTDPLIPRSLCSRWPEGLTRGKVAKKNTLPPMATSGTALLVQISNGPNKTKHSFCLSLTLSHQRSTVMIHDFGSAPPSLARCDYDMQRQRWQLPFLTRTGGYSRLCGQCHADRHQLPQHHGGGQRGAGPPAPSPSPPQRFLPSPAIPAPPPLAGVIRDQPVVRLHSDLLTFVTFIPCLILIPSSSFLSSRSCVLDYDDPDDYLDASNHEVDRQDPLEYEVTV